MANDGDSTGWQHLERLLNAMHEFADGHKVGISKVELEKLRLEFARALENMEEESNSE